MLKKIKAKFKESKAQTKAEATKGGEAVPKSSRAQSLNDIQNEENGSPPTEIVEVSEPGHAEPTIPVHRNVSPPEPRRDIPPAVAIDPGTHN